MQHATGKVPRGEKPVKPGEPLALARGLAPGTSLADPSFACSLALGCCSPSCVFPTRPQQPPQPEPWTNKQHPLAAVLA